MMLLTRNLSFAFRVFISETTQAPNRVERLANVLTRRRQIETMLSSWVG